MVDDALAASGLECLNGGGTTEEVDIFSLSLSLSPCQYCTGELRSPDITEWEGSRAFGDLDLRVLANARRADRGQNKVAARTEQNLV